MSLDVEKVIWELAENIQAKMRVELEPGDPPELFCLQLWLEDLENCSGRVPMHDPVVIREGGVARE